MDILLNWAEEPFGAERWLVIAGSNVEKSERPL
jgi:hypothetical protein